MLRDRSTVAPTRERWESWKARRRGGHRWALRTSRKFNRPEDTGKGLWRDETMTVSGQTRRSRALRPEHIRFTERRLQREAGLTTEKPSLKRRLRSLA